MQQNFPINPHMITILFQENTPTQATAYTGVFIIFHYFKFSVSFSSSYTFFAYTIDTAIPTRTYTIMHTKLTVSLANAEVNYIRYIYSEIPDLDFALSSA